MVWYKTKKAILERMWKNEKSVRSLDRAIKRGEVIEKDGKYGYVLEMYGEMVKVYKAQVEELKKSEFSWGDLEEAQANAEYYKDLYEKEVQDKQERIRKCFRWIQQIKPRADWDEFRDWVMNDD